MELQTLDHNVTFFLNFYCQSCYQFSCNVIYYCISFLGHNIIYSQEKYFPEERLSLGTFKDIWEMLGPKTQNYEHLFVLFCSQGMIFKNLSFKFIVSIHFPFPKKIKKNRINKISLISRFPRWHFIEHTFKIVHIIICASFNIFLILTLDGKFYLSLATHFE